MDEQWGQDQEKMKRSGLQFHCKYIGNVRVKCSMRELGSSELRRRIAREAMKMVIAANGVHLAAATDGVASTVGMNITNRGCILVHTDTKDEINNGKSVFRTLMDQISIVVILDKMDRILNCFDLVLNAHIHETQEKQRIRGPEVDLSNQPWYHGNLSREEAEDRLQEQGDFLVRESSKQPGQKILSGIDTAGISQHILLLDDDCLTVRTRDRVFSSVYELIQEHLNEQLPICSETTPLRLLRPIPIPRKSDSDKKLPVHSLRHTDQL